MTTLTPRPEPAPRWYTAVWRWHFYASLFCIPFVVWLSLTGALYVWRPQIEPLLEWRYDHLPAGGSPASPGAQVAVALRAVPGATLRSYIVPESRDEAVRVLVERHGETWRVTLHPRSLAVLNVGIEEHRPFRLLFHLHGELLAGAVGSYLVETAACWAVVMLLTGLFLWWPRGTRRLAGVVYPRLLRGRTVLWRDLHATAGLWVSVFALGLILTGLPWAKGWGSYLAEVRHLTGTSRGAVDWMVGGKPPKQDPLIGNVLSEKGAARSAPSLRPGDLERVLAAIEPLDVAPPVLVSPPRRAGAPWSVTSNAADRPLRSDLKVDGASGRIVTRADFASRHWIDRTIGIGVAAHEGALFGLANQILATVTALLLSLLALSGAILWWRRRPSGVLGAPVFRPRPRAGFGLVAGILGLGLYMPMFGLTLAIVLLADAFVLRRFPLVIRWLGLESPMRPGL